MEPISSIASAVLSTLAGKIAAGTVVAAASVAGMDAANIVEVPGFADEPESVVVAEDTPQDAEDAKALAEAKKAAGSEDADEVEEADEVEVEVEETDLEEIDGEPNENATFGQSVADRASADDREPGKEFGQTIAGEARTETPGADRAAQPDARPDAPAEVRQDDAQPEQAEDGQAVAEEAPQGSDAAAEQGQANRAEAGNANANGRP
jgi:hypothetical protein